MDTMIILAITTIIVGIIQAIMIFWEIITLKKLIKTINQINEDTKKGIVIIKEKMLEIETKLSPMINALNKATPFLEVFNAITNVFSKKKK